MSEETGERSVAELLEGQPNVVTPVQMFVPTMRLRWSRSGALQQLWSDTLSYNTEWRDVPTEEGE